MNYKLINEALSDISSLRYNHKKFKKVSTSKDGNVNEDEGSQGDYNTITEIYNLGEDDLYIKLVFISDSYGDNLTVNSVQIVKPVVKQVTDFETV